MARSIALATDALVLILTWMKTANIWREIRKIKGPVTVSMLLLRDGSTYFGMSLILNLVALVSNLHQTTVNEKQFVLILDVVSANLLARFMLDLRSVNEQGSSKGRTMSSINFNIQSLGGNIGAPLGIEDSTWVTGPSDDVANERDLQYEEAAIPFRAGLGLDIDEVPLETVNPAGCEASSSRIESSVDVEPDDDIQETPRDVTTAADNV
ncbi:hypothetical protein EIP91_003888 [Steccherinum ochraceum]|uniref:Uncharacterized protein n=1 Tax=Steccherinum ochraceum TaxID=92696 RepID=A0A4R0RB32_9APHY|nr:hypothetical protein EIP91_003888 [Steccherinum ochraceum]